MSGTSLSQRKVQLDEEERKQLENVVTDMRDRVEDNVEFQLTRKNLDRDGGDVDETNLVEAIELERNDSNSWDEAFEQYVGRVGYTIVNRLAALRCMEVRGFMDREITVFKENGLTPAAETLVQEEFMLEDEAILEAYHTTCDELAEEIELLFDQSAYSLIGPDSDTFEALCELLDTVPDAVWRADDVLGWVYEYYNVARLDAVRETARESRLRVEDVSVANQFYTPHWVVRMLTDNSLGKRYLESKQEIQDAIDVQHDLTAEERTDRSVRETETVSELCTYLFVDEETIQSSDADAEMDEPSEIRVLDPACGSGHFLLYAFDVLERIWWQERPDVERHEVPAKILEHNLYGVDIDRRATQLAAFSLYLKGREKAEHWGADSFDLGTAGVVCADSRIINMNAVEIDDAEQPSIWEPLQRIVSAFEDGGLGSLLDVRGTLPEEMLQEQTTRFDQDGVRSLSVLMDRLRDAIEIHQEDSPSAHDLHSFLRLLHVLTREYDVALMNPPYGSQRRMPDSVKRYVKEHYNYYPEYYINFFELCQSVTKADGRIGMLVPRSFMFRRSFREFREDFVGELGSFDFLAEFGNGILDNATVRTVGTVVRSNNSQRQTGTFIRLYDVDTAEKEHVFSTCLTQNTREIRRLFEVPLEDFSKIPWTPLSYTLPQGARDLHGSEQKIDPAVSDVEGERIADIAQGLGTGDNDRFIRKFWEVPSDGGDDTADSFKPYAKGGAEAWIMPNVDTMVDFGDNGREMRPLPGSRVQNRQYYGRAGLTWTYIKATGRRFGYLPAGSIFDQRGPMCFPHSVSPWLLMSVLNSTLYHGLFLSLTPEREWTVGDLGRIPWPNELADVQQLDDFAREQYRIVTQLRSHDVTSPYYVGPALVPNDKRTAFYDHPYTTGDKTVITEDAWSESGYGVAIDQSITSAVRGFERWKRDLEQRLERLASRADDLVYERLGISESEREAIRTEIALRTDTEPTANDVETPEERSITDESVREAVADLLHYCALIELRADSDGIIPVRSSDGVSGIVDRVVTRLETWYGDHAAARLSEIDELLGAKRAGEEAYPNFQEWLMNELFDYHLETMENTPILWRLSTQRLVSDPTGEGFACYVGYHSLDSGTLDRLQTRYLEPRKVALRDRKSAADHRRSDDSLSTREQARATEEYERAMSGLQQIERFEGTLQRLASDTPREWPESARERATQLASEVRTFRKQTQRRLDHLDRLRELTDDEWFADRFSPTFLETVNANAEEWIGVLEDLEGACEAYSLDGSEPVEPSRYGFFSYFGDVVGSDHYSSNGILFMTYYFEREGEALLDQGNPRENPDEETELLANLAANLDEYKSLATKIDEACQRLQQTAPADWETRALAEITTAGYRPNRKHGVAINITPLANAEIVPEVVEDKVI